MDVLNVFTWDLGIALVGCVAAVWAGVSLAKRQARAFRGQSDLQSVNYIDYGDMRFLHLASPAVQGSMKISKPYELHLEYVQRMMAWMLFVDLEHLSRRHAMQLGLGAGSLTKFCHHILAMPTTAVELNPEVVTACRLWFKLPTDNDKLHVLVADAADLVNQTQWHQRVDALQVDLYDREAAKPAIDSDAFYRDCRNLLTDDGCMTVNLFGRDASFAESYQKITSAFGVDAVWVFKPTSAGNTVVVALRTPRPLKTADLQSQAQAIEARWALPAKKWLKDLTPPKTK